MNLSDGDLCPMSGCDGTLGGLYDPVRGILGCRTCGMSMADAAFREAAETGHGTFEGPGADQ